LITGPRRAGKSVFALQLLMNKNFAYLNFDDDLLLKNFDENFVWQYLLEVYPGFDVLFLDEIQNLPDWDIWVGKLYRRGVNLVITGSNANLLSSEMATVLTGRYLPITIMPFSFSEMLAYKNKSFTFDTPSEKAELMLQMTDFMLYGGYPYYFKQLKVWAHTHLILLLQVYFVILKPYPLTHGIEKSSLRDCMVLTQQT
jgi:predicted AAA+ superfamily ATPase